MVSESERKKTSKDFEKVYKSLNPAQREAVDTIEGPVLVVAGPGTGKTQVLAARIANILLKTDVPASAVLALTFTESGVKAMRERLVSLIGAEAYYVGVHTFHSFCSELIQENPEKFIVREDLEPLSELERVQIFRQILDEGRFESLKPFGSRYYYVRALIKSIQDLKREGISPDDFDEVLKRIRIQSSEIGIITKHSESKIVLDDGFEKRDLQKNLELLQVYKRYQEKIAEKSRYDFEDMINLVVEAFEQDETFLRRYQERFQYILLDEFQDTNSPQNKVVSFLGKFWGNDANIFAVGDDEQSVYRFQGASLENILLFRRLYPKARVITLRQNYRSQQEILDAAYTLISHNRIRLSNYIKGIERQLVFVHGGKKLKSARREIGVEVAHFSSGITESFFVGQKIKELIDGGARPSQIAVIYRHNADAQGLADTLSRLKINYNLRAGENVLKDYDLDKILRLLELILKIRVREEDLDLFTVFNYEFVAQRFGLDYLDTLKLARFSSDLKVNFIEAVLHADFEKGKIVRSPRSFITFVNKLLEWQKDGANLTLTALFEKVVNESGFLEWVLGLPDSVEKLNRLNSLFTEIKRLNSFDHTLNLEKFFEDLRVLREAGISVSEEDLEIKTESVVLTTAHGAKGLEFDYVFIVKCLDGKFGNNKTRELIKLPSNLLASVDSNAFGPKRSGPIESDSVNEDERRLFYVALTRARHKVFITYADNYPGDSALRETFPSQFITEIGNNNFRLIDVSPYENKVKELLKDLLAIVPRVQTSIAEKDFLTTVLRDFKLSVTALNTYLECPYKFKLNTLLRTPRAKDKYLSFGSAVHRALELMLRRFRDEGRLPESQFLIDQFEVALQNEILTKKDYEDILLKGRKILKAYYEFYRGSLVRPIFTEKFFGYGFSKVYLGDIPLTGKVDRIDPLPVESYPNVRRPVKVVDYKTGRPRSRSEVEGQTKEKDPSYKRQLIFYKILADLDRSFNYDVVESELDFVEGREGKFVRHSFVISREETEALKALIKEVMGKIRKLEFPRTTNYDFCSYCEFKPHCWPNGVPQKDGQLILPVDFKEESD
ncbi:MAG: ATP-dependent helicase [Patescibacteria group bacterium]|nr:ATP-dependent helicase [Patescibacteria group bacterium]